MSPAGTAPYTDSIPSRRRRWRFRFPQPLDISPVVARYTCFQACPTAGMTAIDIDTGEQRWRRADGVAFVASGPGEAAILTQNGQIQIVDIGDGQARESFDVMDAALVVTNVRDDRIIVLSEDGRRCVHGLMMCPICGSSKFWRPGTAWNPPPTRGRRRSGSRAAHACDRDRRRSVSQRSRLKRPGLACTMRPVRGCVPALCAGILTECPGPGYEHVDGLLDCFRRTCPMVAEPADPLVRGAGRRPTVRPRSGNSGLTRRGKVRTAKRRALITVHDKTGIVEFAQTLVNTFGMEILCTGGTAATLQAAGVPVIPVNR